MKTCTKCKTEKSLLDFPRAFPRKLPSGKTYSYVGSWCKLCLSEYKKNRGANLKDKDNKRLWYNKNKKLTISRAKLWQKGNPEKAKTSAKYYRQNNRDKFNNWNRVFREKNPVAIKLAYHKNLEKLTDGTVRSRLVGSGWPKEAITKDLIEVKRLLIKNKRYGKSKSKTS